MKPTKHKNQQGWIEITGTPQEFEKLGRVKGMKPKQPKVLEKDITKICPLIRGDCVDTKCMAWINKGKEGYCIIWEILFKK